jgi:hypothetical protein
MQAVLLQKGSEFCGRVSGQQQHLIRFVSLVGALSVIISQLNKWSLECGKIGTFQMRNSSRKLHDSNLHRALFDYCVYDVLRISLGVVLDFEKRKQQHAKYTFFHIYGIPSFRKNK